MDIKIAGVTLTEEELFAVGVVLKKFKYDYNLKKEASPEAKDFDEKFNSAYEKIWDKINILTA